MNPRRVHRRPRKGNVGRTAHQGAAVLPVHITEGQLCGLVRGSRVGHRTLVVGKSAGYITFQGYIALNVCGFINVLFGPFFAHDCLQRIIRLQQRHGIACRHTLRRSIDNVKLVRT